MDSDEFFSPTVSEFEKIDNDDLMYLQDDLLNGDISSDLSSQESDHDSPPIFETPHSQRPSSVADPITVSFPAPGVNLSLSSTFYPQITFPYTNAAQSVEAVSASYGQLGQQNFSYQAPNRLENLFSPLPTPIRPAAPKQGRRSTGSQQSPEGDYLFKILNDFYHRTVTHQDLLALMNGLHQIYPSFPRPSRDCCRAKVTLLTFYAPYQTFIIDALISGVVPISA